MWVGENYYESPEGCPGVCTARWNEDSWARWEETQRERAKAISEAIKNSPPEPVLPLREGWYLIKPMGPQSSVRAIMVQVHPKDDGTYVLFNGETVIETTHDDMLWMQAEYYGELSDKKPRIY